MKNINILWMLLLVVVSANYSQDVKLLYTDDRMKYDVANGVIEDNDGNFVYVGGNGNDWQFDYSTIVKISSKGDEVIDRRDIKIGERAKFDNIFLTENNTYFVIGSSVKSDGVYLVTREFSMDFEVMAECDTKIHDNIKDCSEIDVKIKKYAPGQYVALLEYVYRIEDSRLLYFCQDICKIDKSGKVVIRKDASWDIQGYDPVNVASINAGEAFLLFINDGYFVYDSELNFVAKKTFSDMYKTFGADEFRNTDGVVFSNGKLRYFHAKGGPQYGSLQHKKWSFSFVNIDENITEDPEPTTKAFFLGEYGYRRALAKYVACDYITDDNLLFVGTVYGKDVPNIGYHSPTKIVVGSYNQFTDELNWSGVFGEDYQYDATSIRATKDGGAIVVATKKAAYVEIDDGSKESVLIKFNKSVTPSVNNVDADHLFSIYPNPASRNITLKLDDEGTQTVDFYDSTGRLCKTVNVSSAEENINIADLTKGIYLLKLKADGKTVANERLVVK